MEKVADNYVTQLDVAADMDGIVTVTAHTASKKSTDLKVSVADPKGKVVATHSGSSDKEFRFQVSNAKLWSPDSPTLYNLTVTMGKDEVHSYTGFRTISSGVVNGVKRPLLNGKFQFIFGTLDQGFWPDGLYTPPNREAMIYDLKMLKNLGFNMLRKHVRRHHFSPSLLTIADQSRARPVLPGVR